MQFSLPRVRPKHRREIVVDLPDMEGLSPSGLAANMDGTEMEGDRNRMGTLSAELTMTAARHERQTTRGSE